MNFAIFYNPNKPDILPIVKSISSFLLENGSCIYFEEKNLNVPEAKILSSCDFEVIDFCLCLGGDGSILRAVHRHPEMQAPILGINMGSLGFLADIPTHKLFEALNGLLKGHYKIESRMMIEGMMTKNKTCFSVNEIVLHRARNPSLIDLAIYVDGKYLNTFSADGVIFATATGSTAYSLSAGGPILTPDLSAFIITPICPHTITNRPIVLMPKEEIRVQYTSLYSPIEVIFDGFTSFLLESKEEIIIKRANRDFKTVLMDGHDYFSTLRTKLNWSGKLKI
ncbi:MAG TPA: NAD(+)/NADH kinase [Parachlamydiaceae bacterium]|nr:NAD(+)/NADH kinase [Parachlamydiaceae bacterium]